MAILPPAVRVVNAVGAQQVLFDPVGYIFLAEGEGDLLPDGWYASSEDGMHLEGPFASEAEATQVLATGG